MSEKTWLVFDVGCIECGASSAVVGVFATKEEAAAVVAAEEQDGQHYFGVWDLAPFLASADAH